MSAAWDEGDHPDPRRITLQSVVRIAYRAVILSVLVFGGLLLLLIVRILERPLYGQARPWTPRITQFVCRNAFRVLGLPLRVFGGPMTHRGAVVANHASWLDIFALNASKRIYFVSKSEVARWPGIGWLARATGTVFIERNRSRAKEQTRLFETRLLAGHKLLFFPEGTSTDGLRVLPFKTTLFEAFFTPHLRKEIWIQPAVVFYVAPPCADSRFYGWWGDMSFGTHLLATLAAARQGWVEVHYGTPLKVADFDSRKALAQASEKAVRKMHTRVKDRIFIAAPTGSAEPPRIC